MIRRVSLQPDEDIIKIANKKAMQAVCEAAEGFLNDVAVWGFRDEIVVNLKAALEKWSRE